MHRILTNKHSNETRARGISAGSALARAVAFLVIPLCCFFAAACGGSTAPAHESSPTPGQNSSTASTPPAAGAPPVSTTVARAEGLDSLHDRVMAEQGRGPGATVGRRRATGIVGSPSEPTTTTLPSAPTLDGATGAVLADGQTPLVGTWNGTAERLASFLLAISPSPRFTVPAETLAEYYLYYCAQAGLRADLLWAQMIHETGYGMFEGCVLPEQNNYAGIGATGGGEPGLFFATAEAGVMAHVAHMVAYVYDASPVTWADASTDPRFDYVSPRGVARVLSDLNGRWAVPGTSYGENIEAVARSINAG